jgi:hypothetical protein
MNTKEKGGDPGIRIGYRLESAGEDYRADSSVSHYGGHPASGR